MKTKTVLSVLVFGLFVSVFSQKTTMKLTFTAENNGLHVPLDSIYIENLTQGGDTMIYAPDTLLIIDYLAGVNEINFQNNGLILSQNTPNPFQRQTNIGLYVPKTDKVRICIHNITGEELNYFESKLTTGNHSFTFYPGYQDYYILSAHGSSGVSTIKMINTGIFQKGLCRIEYDGLLSEQTTSKSKAVNMGFVFMMGDQLRFIGYAKTSELILGSAFIEDVPQTNEFYQFEIWEGILCVDVPYINYGDRQYNTVQVGNQCWMKENLNIGTMISGIENMTNNNTIEKYCFYNDTIYCNVYGGLYQWNEVMQYTTLQGTQGICPVGWHLPSDAEIKELEIELGMSQASADSVSWRGTNQGSKLAGNGSLWNDSYLEFNAEFGVSGFIALPGGYRNNSGSFNSLGDITDFWSSSYVSGSSVLIRGLNRTTPKICRYEAEKSYGFSVRCLRD